MGGMSAISALSLRAVSASLLTISWFQFVESGRQNADWWFLTIKKIWVEMDGKKKYVQLEDIFKPCTNS